ncbi:MAG: isoleucine--tRNA ligase [Candidatus Bostrichicola ureolyticus]|nr:MAG: isoleucine--tRNA ligase [Candidatus Bostrichicola ureolyticus]
MFKTYKKLNLQKIYNIIIDFWNKNNTFEKSISSRKSSNTYIFYEGPPSANGMPGIHHVMGRTIKDIFCRFFTLKGKQVKRKSGWDTHGLPIELNVEDKLGITKEDIGKKISIKEYNNICKSSVMRYTNLWNELTKKLGFWIDTKNPYITYETKYIESIWWSIKELYNKNLLYKDYTIQPYSPAAGTSLSSHELNMHGAYKNITDITITVQFKIIKESLPVEFKSIKGDIYTLVWTTTPWTIPSNTALAINKDLDYQLISTYNPYNLKKINIILAKKLVENNLHTNFISLNKKLYNTFDTTKISNKNIPYFTLLEFKGNKIIGCRYEQLLNWALPYKNVENAFKIIHGDFINTNEGTGIVHIAPTFGVDDALIAKKYGIPPMLIINEKKEIVPLVDLQGRFLKIINNSFAGKYVKNQYYRNNNEIPKHSVDEDIAILLKKNNKAFKIEKYTHAYPHCWRTEKPILYYPIDSWIIKTTSVKNRLVELNKMINWTPKVTGEKRFNNWLKNINDWNISRSRYWGIPLPIWKSIENNEILIIGSIEELIMEIKKSIKKGFMKENPFKDFIIGNMSDENYNKIDLHKHIVDQIILVSKSGNIMKREPDLIDVWFDSGAMPYAQWHYPFENKNFIDNNKFFPADFVAEGIDQTRGWFYTLHAISCMLFDSIAYKNVISNGIVLDKKGQKMSKSKGNTINPFKILENFGADTVRWYMISNTQPWENLKFDIEGIEEIKRKFFGTLYNTYIFFAVYANIDGFKYEEKFINLNDRPEIDRWILSKLNSLIKKVDYYYTNYNPTLAARSIMNFVIDNLSNWYIRLCRRRFWKTNYSIDKISAYQTLYECLLTISKIASPISPFFMENLYKDLNDKIKKEFFDSVHLSYFPTYNNNIINEELEYKIDLTKKVTSMVFSLRKKVKIKVRQPLEELLIITNNKKIYIDLQSTLSIIKQEVNVKNIYFGDKKSNSLIKKIKPNFKLLGSRLKEKLKLVTNVLNNFTQKDILKIEQEGKYILNIQGEKIFLLKEEVEIYTYGINDWLVLSDKDFTLSLNTHITDSLKKEGIIREFISIIQKLRKKNKLEVIDKILLFLKCEKQIYNIIKEHINYICEETLTTKLSFQNNNNGEMINLSGYIIYIYIKKYDNK